MRSKEDLSKLISRARAHVRAGRYDTAIEDFNRAASIYAEQGDSCNEVLVFQEMADMYRLAKETDRALDIYARLLDPFENLQDAEAKARTLNNMGLLLARMASYDDALATFREALAIFEGLGKPLHIAEQWGNIGSMYRNSNKCGLAMESYNRAFPIYRKLKCHEGVADQYTWVTANPSTEPSMLHQESSSPTGDSWRCSRS